jgi:hypothetical protein
MYGAVYSAVVNGMDSFAGSQEPGSVFLAVLAVAAILIIQLFIVRFLWNTVLVRVTTVVKPIPSLIYTLGLLVLVAMVFPGL